jgi:hypothetical protein
MKQFLFLPMLIFVLFINSCSSTSVTSTWKAQDFTAPKYNKIMVVGIFRGADVQLQQQMEAHLVGDLNAQGLKAYSSFQEYGPKALQNMNEDAINKKLAAEGVDAVVTITLLDKERERYYTPGRVVYTPYATYHNYFHGYYRSIYTRIETPGYYQTLTKYFWESEGTFDKHIHDLDVVDKQKRDESIDRFEQACIFYSNTVI